MNVEITDVFIGTYPGCMKPEHSDEILSMMQLLSQGTRWPGTTLMDCGCVNQLFQAPPDESLLEDWRVRLEAGTEAVDRFDHMTGRWHYG